VPGSPDYVLQRINTHVFPEPEKLMENMSGVISHIKHQKRYAHLVPELIETESGAFFVKTESGFWRMYRFVEGAKSFDRAENEQQVWEGGFANGSFLKALESFPIEKLYTVIPDFHNMVTRIRQFEEALETTSKERKEWAFDEIISIQKKKATWIKMFQSAVTGNIPVRVTHNDTKFNNVLLSEHSKKSCVIDLDTVMPGYTFFDIGDGLRSAVISANENESDLSLVVVNEHFYQSYIDGFIDGSDGLLTSEEKQLIPKSGGYMAFIMAVRFLTDFLKGDIYYKTHYAEHNLGRAKNQLYVSALFEGIS